MKKEKKTELKGALKALGIIVLLGMVCVGSAMGYATISDDDFHWSVGDVVFNSTGFFINSTNVIDINAGQTATFIVAASDSLHKERADYVCLGVDDQVVIQAAIDALSANGGTVLLLEGVYAISDNITITKSNINLVGVGTATKLNNINTNNKPAIFIEGDGWQPTTEEIRIADLVVYGNPNSGHGIEAIYVFRLILDDLLLHSNGGDGMNVTRINDAFISNCRMRENSGSGLVIDVHEGLITNCYSGHNGARGFYVIFISDTMEICFSSCASENNVLSGFETQPGVAMATFVSCTSDVDRNGFRINGLHSTISSCSVAGANFHGITLWGAKYVSVVGNILYGNNEAGIFVKDSDNSVIIGNICTNTTIWPYPDKIQKYGIKETNTADWNIIQGNNVIGNSEQNIIKVGANTVVQDNIGWTTKNLGSSTGTGAQQLIAHGLAATPTKVILWNIEDGANPYQNATASATNIYITAVVNQDYGWEAEVV